MVYTLYRYLPAAVIFIVSVVLHICVVYYTKLSEAQAAFAGTLGSEWVE